MRSLSNNASSTALTKEDLNKTLSQGAGTFAQDEQPWTPKDMSRCTRNICHAAMDGASNPQDHTTPFSFQNLFEHDAIMESQMPSLEVARPDSVPRKGSSRTQAPHSTL